MMFLANPFVHMAIIVALMCLALALGVWVLVFKLNEIANRLERFRSGADRFRSEEITASHQPVQRDRAYADELPVVSQEHAFTKRFPMQPEHARMSRLSQNLISIFVGVISGLLGAALVAVFWPLLFPLSLQGSSAGEDAVGVAFLAFFLLFGVSGFLLCRRWTSSRYS
jgi:hypothetical protein